jgi:hypothetical protein
MSFSPPGLLSRVRIFKPLKIKNTLKTCLYTKRLLADKAFAQSKMHVLLVKNFKELIFEYSTLFL